jgi:putative nucleotidyltransferase with HDIG domain
MNRDEAWHLLTAHTPSASLRRHALGVEAAMRHYAQLANADVELWGVTGLLHDLDYERFPEAPAHTREGARILREAGVNEEIVGAMLSHAEWNHAEYPLDRPLRKTLYAVDELSGFVYAVACVRPERLAGLTAASVRKKLKQKAFAAAVSRDQIHRGADLLGLPLDEHVQHVISALQGIAPALGLA